ncbi:MAG: LAGLIDADG family homing endonuclease, partial [Candidatus Odinarchaeota archaeon]
SGKGSSAAGLCVSGDSNVFLSNCIQPISQIVEREFETGGIERYNGYIEYKKNLRGDLQVYHSSDLKVLPRIISKVWRIDSPESLIEIVSRTGRELKLTAETGVLSVDREAGLVWKPAKLLKPGDRVATAKNLSTTPLTSFPSVYELIADFPADITLLNVENRVKNLLKRIKEELNFSIHDLAARLGVNESTPYRWGKKTFRGNITLENFSKLCKLLEEDIEEHLPLQLLVEGKKGQKIILPKELDEEWFYILGLIIVDGRVSVEKREEGCGEVTISFSGREPALLKGFTDFFQGLGLKVNLTKNPEERSVEARIRSALIYHIFAKFGLKPSPMSTTISLNNEILFYQKKYLNSLLRGIFDSDGWIETRKEGSSQIGLASTSKSLIHFVQNALLTHGIISYIREREPKTAILKSDEKTISKNTKYELSFNRYSDFVSFEQKIGFNHPKKKQKLIEYCQTTEQSYDNVDNIPDISFMLKEIIDFYSYTSSEFIGRKNGLSPCYSKNNDFSSEYLSMIIEKIEPDLLKHRVNVPYDTRNLFFKEIQQILTEKSLSKIAKLPYQQLYEVFMRKGRNPSVCIGIIISLFEETKTRLKPETREYWSNLIENVKAKHEEFKKKYHLLKSFCGSDIFWDEVVTAETVVSRDPFVYDLTIPQTHNFIVNGFVVHNTAAVVHDPETKELTLEAGALVLADRGIAIVDEFDKMDANDRAGLHEAMEAHTVSIAKAGIVATLNARCSILAAANPKLGRWDADKDLNYNLNLPPAIISRFDLIFPLVDKPDPQLDRERAAYILSQHQKAALAEEPPADANFIRKFIAYVRQTCHPKLTSEANEHILDFYLKLRTQSTEVRPDGKPKSIAITPRQLEAIIRLSEAHAKAALREEVTFEDADAAIKLMEETLRMVATDPKTGEIDVDRVTSGRSSATRSRVKIVNDIIEELTRDGDPASLKEIIRKAEENNLKKSDVEEIIHDLVQNGVYFEPSPGKIKKIS